MSRQDRSFRMVWALIAAALSLSCARAALPVRPVPAVVQVDFIAVNHGDSILVASSAGKSVLIDGGEAEAADAVLAVLRKRGVCPLDMILLTHPHADHAGGLAKVIDGCGARMFMDSGHPHASQVYARLLERIEKRGIPLHQAVAGRRIDLGAGATLTLLGPPHPPIASSTDEVNANSVVARLALGQTSLLLTGDAEFAEEKWLLSKGESTLRATVLKVGHHGSRTSTSADFLAAVAPRLAVISNRLGDAKHPHPETLERFRRAGVQILETAHEGTIHLELDGETVAIHTEKNPVEVRLP